MRQCLAAVLALAVCLLQAEAQAFHVHRVHDHDQADRHQHGPAIHHHPQHPSESDHRVKLTDDDETTGAVVMLTVPASAQLDLASADCAAAKVASFEPVLEIVQRMVALDVHSHGPPSLRRPSYRGPPASKPS